METATQEQKDHSFVDWSELEHVQDVEVYDVKSLNSKLVELYEMDFIVKVEQLRYRQLFYVGIGAINKYLIKIYKRAD